MSSLVRFVKSGERSEACTQFCVIFSVTGWSKMLLGMKSHLPIPWWVLPLRMTSYTTTWARHSRRRSWRWLPMPRVICMKLPTGEAGASSTCTTTSPPTAWPYSLEVLFWWTKVCVLSWNGQSIARATVGQSCHGKSTSIFLTVLRYLLILESRLSPQMKLHPGHPLGN